MNRFYPLGKLPAEHLARLLARYAPDDPAVVLGPGVGRDAAVIDLGERYLIAKTDPITFATDEIGWYAVHVNANDVACTGAAPRWFLATLLLPGGKTDAPLVNEIFEQIDAACNDLGISLVGGHTEITHGLDRPIVVGQMLGQVAPERLVRPSGARPGDRLILTKGIAVEGTAIIAREIVSGWDEANGGSEVSREVVARSRDFLHDPGISVVRDAAVATATGDVHAMHDPTEGGVATGLWELAEAAGVGMVIDEAALPILPETRVLCRPLGMDPLGLIASGALLLAVAPEDDEPICAALAEEAIDAWLIGRVAQPERGRILQTNEGERPLPRFDRDEIARLFE